MLNYDFLQIRMTEANLNFIWDSYPILQNRILSLVRKYYMALSSSTIHSQVCYQAINTVRAADDVNKSYFTLKIAFCKKM